MITNGFVTAFSLRYEPAVGTLTSVMSRDGLVVTNTFTGINLAADVQDTAAYIGFGSGTGGSYQELFVSDFRVAYDTPADAGAGPDDLAALTLPGASTNTVTLDTSLPGRLFRITSADVGDGATLGVNAAREPGTLVFGATALAGNAAFEIETGCTLAVTDVTGGEDIVKRGAGTLALAGATAAYAGDTRLEGGTLALDAARLPRATDLHVSTGATLSLAFTGKQYVHALYVDGAPMPGGVYTAAKAAWITGPGTLVVTYPPVGSMLFLK
jgi:autotransporter-associated beta strand protein